MAAVGFHGLEVAYRERIQPSLRRRRVRWQASPRQRPQQEIGRAIVNRLRRSGQSTRGDTPGLRQNLVDNSAMNIGEAHVAAAKWVGQFGVVQS